jgi:hypothetical protein
MKGKLLTMRSTVDEPGPVFLNVFLRSLAAFCKCFSANLKPLKNSNSFKNLSIIS